MKKALEREEKGDGCTLSAGRSRRLRLWRGLKNR